MDRLVGHVWRDHFAGAIGRIVTGSTSTTRGLRTSLSRYAMVRWPNLKYRGGSRWRDAARGNLEAGRTSLDFARKTLFDFECH